MKLLVFLLMATVWLQLPNGGTSRNLLQSWNDPSKRDNSPEAATMRAFFNTPLVQRVQEAKENATREGHFPPDFFESDDWKEFVAVIRFVLTPELSDEEIIAKMKELIPQTGDDDDDDDNGERKDDYGSQGNARSLSHFWKEPSKRSNSSNQEAIDAFVNSPLGQRIFKITEKAIKDGHFPPDFFESDDWKEFVAAVGILNPNYGSEEELIAKWRSLIKQKGDDYYYNDDDDSDEDDDDTQLAIIASPQWRALMVLTATKAEMNDPNFLSKWVDDDSSNDLYFDSADSLLDSESDSDEKDDDDSGTKEDDGSGGDDVKNEKRGIYGDRD